VHARMHFQFSRRLVVTSVGMMDVPSCKVPSL
jgi:hypothetical protein